MTWCVNFLPESYQLRRKKRRRVCIEIAIVAVAAASAITWYITTQTDLSALTEQARQLEIQAAQVNSTLEQIGRLQKHEQQLTKQRQLQNELIQPVTYTQVVATIADLSPRAIALVELDLVADRKKPMSMQDAVNAAEQAKKAKKKKDATPAKREWIQVTVMGISPNDDLIADFVSALTGHGAFEEVKIQYTQPTEFANVRGRMFRLTLAVPLDCKYVPAIQASANNEQGVAHAH